MDIPEELLRAFPPDAKGALDLARHHVDDDMLMVVACADYGLGADERFAELLPIRNTGMVPPLQFWLHEVLSLTRWINVPDPDDAPSDTLRKHQIRAFACATLLLASAQPDNISGEADDSDLAFLLTSAVALGDDWSLAAAKFATWRITDASIVPDELLFSLALLVLSVRLRKERFSDRDLGRIAEWVMAAEARQGKLLLVLGLEPPPQIFSVQQGFWDRIVAELKEAAQSISDEETRLRVLLCSQLVEPNWR